MRYLLNSYRLLVIISWLDTVAVFVIADTYRANFTGCPSDPQRHKKKAVTFGVIAPNNIDHEQSLFRILPAVNLAVDKVNKMNLLPGWTLDVKYGDSQCSSTHGPLIAMEFYFNKSAGLFSFMSNFKIHVFMRKSDWEWTQRCDVKSINLYSLERDEKSKLNVKIIGWWFIGTLSRCNLDVKLLILV